MATMAVTGIQLQEAERRLVTQIKDYRKAGIPIEFSSKILVLNLEGFGQRVLKAARIIEEASLKITQQPPSLTPMTMGPGDQGTLLVVPSLHFDFEVAEAELIRLITEMTVSREVVSLKSFQLYDSFVGVDTVHPLDVPVEWTTCTIPGIPTIRIEGSTLGDPKKTGFKIDSSAQGTSIRNLHDVSVDPRLTRMKLYLLLRDLVTQTKEHRTSLVDIQFYSQDQA